MDDNNFFSEVHGSDPDKGPQLPDQARTQELYGILPNTLIFPPVHPEQSPFAVDRESDVLHIDVQYLVNHQDREPHSLYNRLPLLRIYNDTEHGLADVFIADVRVTAFMSLVRKLHITEINALYEYDDLEREKMYIPVRGLVHETSSGEPAFSGDDALLSYGKGLLLAVNEHIFMGDLLDQDILDRHPSFAIPF